MKQKWFLFSIELSETFTYNDSSHIKTCLWLYLYYNVDVLTLEQKRIVHEHMHVLNIY